MMNNKYFFILGNNPALSLIEILAVAQQQQIMIKLIDYFDYVLLVQMDQEFDFSILGGSIKFGTLLDGSEQYDWSIVESILQRQIIENQKFNFGFSYYFDEQKKIKQWQKECEKNSLHWKKLLAQQGQSARLVSSRETELSSIIVSKEKLLIGGCELLLICRKNKFYYGITKQVQDWRDFGQRDYGKPQVDATSGMLPPKLARLMINLAQLPKEQALFDPFCGSGVLLLEAMTMGYQKILGSDISQKAVTDSKKNYQWYQQQHPELQCQVQINSTDATTLPKELVSEKIGAVVTEPYLGPAWKTRPTFSRIQQVQKELQNLYCAFFSSLNQITLPGTKLVMVWPVFRLGQQILLTYQPHLINNRQWQVVDYSQELNNFGIFGISNFIYSRPDQVVGRQIITFCKQ